MAAPPIVANAEAQAFLNEVEDIEGPPSVRAARSSKRLGVARELHVVNGITEAELGEHEGFHIRCALHAAGPAVAVEEAIANVPGVPPWFGPAMAAALQPVQAQLTAALQPIQAQLNVIDGRLDNIEGRLDNIEGRLDNIEGRLDNIEARMDNSEARLINSIASEP
jgi:tetrahydromethanopterin S-methyltransferase subunit G